MKQSILTETLSEIESWSGKHEIVYTRPSQTELTPADINEMVSQRIITRPLLRWHPDDVLMLANADSPINPWLVLYDCAITTSYLLRLLELGAYNRITMIRNRDNAGDVTKLSLLSLSRTYNCRVDIPLESMQEPMEYLREHTPLRVVYDGKRMQVHL